MHRHHYSNHSIESVDSQEGDNEKYQDPSGSLIHGMQPSDDNDLQHCKYHNTHPIPYDVHNEA
jgi:hypothetical protein